MILFPTRLAMLGVVAGLSLFAGGCSTPEHAAAKPKPKYVYVPTTGSHLGRRVLVNPDGTLADSNGDSVQTAAPNAVTDLQRKGSVGRGRGN